MFVGNFDAHWIYQHNPCIVLNMKQFNGRLACNFFEHEGVSRPSSHLHHNWSYQPDITPRTHKSFIHFTPSINYDHTRLMTKFLKCLKNGEFNLNPDDEILARPLSEIHFKCTLLALYQTRDSEAKWYHFFHGDIKTARNVSGLRLCKSGHVDRELSQNFVA